MVPPLVLSQVQVRRREGLLGCYQWVPGKRSQ